MANTYPRSITASLLQAGLVATDGTKLGYRVISSVDGSDLIPRTVTGITEVSPKKYRAVIAAWDRSWIGTILWEDANDNILAWEDFLDSDPSSLVWSALLSGLSTANSIGFRFAQFLGQIGSDNRPKLSADVHTSGASVDLKATGLDQIAVGDPGPIAGQTTFPKRLMAMWRSTFGPYKLTKTGNGIGTRVYLADDGTTVNATQAITETVTQQTIGKAS